MWKAGHSLIKAKMKANGAALAGEMSGHIFCADRFYGFDDAPMQEPRAEILSKTEKAALSAYSADLRKQSQRPRYAVPCPRRQKIRGRPDASPTIFSTTHDSSPSTAARILFDQRWGLVRASNTQAILVLRFESDTPKHLDMIRSEVEMKLKSFLQA
jgi:phosphomannomutase/phosphoglucomutase